MCCISCLYPWPFCLEGKEKTSHLKHLIFQHRAKPLLYGMKKPSLVASSVRVLQVNAYQQRLDKKGTWTSSSSYSSWSPQLPLSPSKNKGSHEHLMPSDSEGHVVFGIYRSSSLVNEVDYCYMTLLHMGSEESPPFVSDQQEHEESNQKSTSKSQPPQQYHLLYHLPLQQVKLHHQRKANE